MNGVESSMPGPLSRRAILSDDLTGACDAGVHCARLGRSVACWDSDSFGEQQADWLIASSLSRAMQPQDAAAAVASMATAIGQAGFEISYKKVDSTLRGPLAEELESVLDCLPATSALVATAYPAMGRSVLDGRLCLHGEPVGDATLEERFQGGRSRVIPLGLHDIRSNQLAEQLTSLANERAIIVADAQTDDDLARLATAIVACHKQLLPVGSAGLIQQLVHCWQPEHRGAAADNPLPTMRQVICVIGSQNVVTREQCQQLVNQRQAVAMELSQISATRPGEAVIVLTMNWEDDPTRGRDQLRGWIASQQSVGLVLSGGDTALQVCNFLGGHGILLESELTDGVPRGLLLSAGLSPTTVVTKAGGFGDASSLVTIVDTLLGNQL